MSSIMKVIEKMKLNVLSIDGVPDSFSSEVYKLTLAVGEHVSGGKYFNFAQISGWLRGEILFRKNKCAQRRHLL